MKAIIHAGGESTRLKEIYQGPKPLLPVGKPPRSLLWLHLQPLIKSEISEYIFTLRYESEIVQKNINELAKEFGIVVKSVIEPSPLGRAGAIRFGIENGVIDPDETYLMSHPDDLIPINIKKLIDFKEETESKTLILVMAKSAMSPFGIGRINDNFELLNFEEKPELPLPKNHIANTGMALYMPEAMKEFLNVPKDRPTNPEDFIIPKLIKEKKAAAFIVPRWISVNYKSDYLRIKDKKLEELVNFLTRGYPSLV